jgi:hypothetical protein
VRRAIEIIQSCNNVFENLGFDAEEAIKLKIKADPILDLEKAYFLRLVS